MLIFTLALKEAFVLEEERYYMAYHLACLEMEQWNFLIAAGPRQDIINPVLEQNQPMDNEKQGKARKCFIWKGQEAVPLVVTSAGSAARQVDSLILCFC